MPPDIQVFRLVREKVFGKSALWFNQQMFARKIRVEYEQNGKMLPCPLKWLDSFSMRNFTNASVFDDTLPVSDGSMEVGSGVPLNQLKEAMEDWFWRKSYLPKTSHLMLGED
ncbi:MAG TPA: hypothetical protein VGS78_09460 [Candidatus Sulfotelmatobacter sp.]|nr:hypothetical protein [Candidatus Sulfotelmatobacter sp.]